VLAGDVVLIPVQSSSLDVWGASAVVSLQAEAAMVRPNLKAAFVISRKMVNTALVRDVPGTLVDYRLSTLTAALAQRVAFAESMGAGLTVFDLNPRSVASAEVEAMTKEVMEFAHGQEGYSGAAAASADR
jgi:chromosome partitioning protein